MSNIPMPDPKQDAGTGLSSGGARSEAPSRGSAFTGKHAASAPAVQSYSVSSACKMVGVSSRQLYYWETLGIVTPFYEQFGSYYYRRYPAVIIKALVKIKALMDKGYTLRAAAQKVTGKDFNGRKNGAGSRLEPKGSNGHER